MFVKLREREQKSIGQGHELKLYGSYILDSRELGRRDICLVIIAPFVQATSKEIAIHKTIVFVKRY